MASILPAARLDDLFATLKARGFRVVGPRLRAGAIVLDDISSTSDIERGVKDEVSPGRYRAHATDSLAYFENVVGPTTLRPFLDPASRRLFRVHRTGRSLAVIPDDDVPPPVAVIGARACDVAALAISDRVHDDGAHRDRHYLAARRGLFVVAVECTTHASTCFCTRMGTGPSVERGHDLKLTELVDEAGHRFVVASGSREGDEVLRALSLEDADPRDVEHGHRLVFDNAATMDARPLDVRAPLIERLEHPRYDDVAERCLSCGNCTLVCPTCFCSTIEDGTDVTTGEHTRSRRWDSCFTSDHSLLHGHSVRTTTASRYRQWLTHKLSTWHDQFGTAGCTGCGRCIAWCPVGIDIRDEASAIVETSATPAVAQEAP